MHILKYTIIYIQIHANTYHSLHIETLDSPQSVWHDVCAIQRLSLLLIRCLVACISCSPFRSLPLKEFSSLVVQQPVGSTKHLGLLGVSILGGMLACLMQKVLRAMSELARLSTVAAIGVGLRLV